MNPIFHFLFNYLFIELVFGTAWENIIVIIIASLLIDFTHLPYLMKVKSGVVNERFGSECRTRFHEIYGLAVFSLLLCVIYTFFDPMTTSIAALCLVLHFALDFVAGKSMPFYPYDKTEVLLGLMPYGYKKKILFEVSTTILLGVVFWLKIKSFIL
ncbi:MAG: hypothetical protein KAS04_05550 [Candidatus Aenigmarchaeota archaeon]|nr:hypothetical protein [Candidatus Aenigmarchaeota archaeon]